jgi:uroporphyrin-III C-methyltransferase
MSDAVPSLESPAPRKVGARASALTFLLALIALLLAGFAAWQGWQLRRVDVDEESARARSQRTQAQQLADATQVAQSARDALAPLERRIENLEGINRSLREELLGLGERAKLTEDALARVADRRLAGAVMMRVNEAEYLLHLGQVRLQLFHDADATATALRLADTELAALDDPIFAGVRQTIAAEIDELAQTPLPDRGALADRLAQVSGLLPKLVARGAPQSGTEVATRADAGLLDRAAGVLSQYVRIREHDAAEPLLLSPLQAEAARAALSVELALAKAAVLDGDAARARAAIARAQQLLQSGFAEDAVRREARTTLEQVAAAPLDAQPPAIGKALDELRNLRATRSLADRESTAPPAPVDADAPGGDENVPPRP